MEDNKNNQKVLIIKDVSFCYGTKEALHDVSFTVHSGEVVGIVGKTGSGTSTLMKVCAGIFPAKSGRVERSSKKEHGLAGYSFDLEGLISNLNVFENIALALRYHNLFNEKIIKQKTRDVMKILDLEKVGNDRPDELSAIMYKRVNIARALVIEPDILFLDNTLSGLSWKMQEEIWRIIENMKKVHSMTVLIASHSLKDVLSKADRVIVLSEGTVSLSEDVQEVAKHTDTLSELM